MWCRLQCCQARDCVRYMRATHGGHFWLQQECSTLCALQRRIKCIQPHHTKCMYSPNQSRRMKMQSDENLCVPSLDTISMSTHFPRHIT